MYFNIFHKSSQFKKRVFTKKRDTFTKFSRATHLRARYPARIRAYLHFHRVFYKEL